MPSSSLAEAQARAAQTAVPGYAAQVKTQRNTLSHEMAAELLASLEMPPATQAPAEPAPAEDAPTERPERARSARTRTPRPSRQDGTRSRSRRSESHVEPTVERPAMRELPDGMLSLSVEGSPEVVDHFLRYLRDDPNLYGLGGSTRDSYRNPGKQYGRLSLSYHL